MSMSTDSAGDGETMDSWKHEAIALRETGYGIREIARELNRPYTTVWECIRGVHPIKDPALPAKILIADIETAPGEAYYFRRWKTNIHEEMVIRKPHLLCWAAKWYGDDTILTDSLFDNQNHYWKNPNDDRNVIASMWKLLDKADMVVFHNGDRFDIPKLKSGFIRHGFHLPSPFRSIDTLKIAKPLGFDSNALDAIARELNIEVDGVVGKKDTGGFRLWRGCLEGDKESWDKMMEYNIHDVNVLEAVYSRLRSYAKSHPNVALHINKENPQCGVCGRTTTQA